MDTSAAVISDDPWLSLDSARTHHLNGDHVTAWAILERIAIQGGDRQGFTEARRELSAYVLMGLEMYPAAFDSLRTVMLARDSVHEAKLLRSEEDAAMRIDSIQQQLEERDNLLERTIASYARHRTELQWIIGIAGVTLLAIIIFLLVDRKSKPVVAKETTEAVETPAAQASAIEPAGLRSNDPLDPSVVHAHISAIAQHLGRNNTIEGAAHAAELSRFMRVLMEHEEKGAHPAHHAVVVLRQYLKLSSLLIGKRIKYEVRAAREMMDRSVMVPTREIIRVLARVMEGAADGGTPVLDVELVAGSDGAGAQCIISTPVAGEPDPAPLRSVQVQGISQIDQGIGERNGEPVVLITISW